MQSTLLQLGRRTLVPFLCVSALSAVSLLLAQPAQADIILNLSTPSLAGDPGTNIQYLGTITNTGGTTVFLNGGNIDSLPAFLTDDVDTFFNNVPVSLASGESFTGALFGINIDPTAVPDTYIGSFSLLGGAESSDLTVLASTNFQTTVNVVTTAVTPEPGSTALLLTGLGVFAAPLVRRLRRSA